MLLLRRFVAILVAHCIAAVTAVAVLAVAGATQYAGPTTQSVAATIAILCLTVILFVAIGFVVAAIVTVPATALSLLIAIPLLRTRIGRLRFTLIGGVIGVVLGVPATRATLALPGPHPIADTQIAILNHDIAFAVVIAAFVDAWVFAAMLWRRRGLFRPSFLEASA